MWKLSAEPVPSRFSPVLSRLSEKNVWGRGEDYVLFPEHFLLHPDEEDNLHLISRWLKEEHGLVGTCFFREPDSKEWYFVKRTWWEE